MAQAREKLVSAPVKVPPQNIEAEQAVLSGILINNEAMNQVVDILSPDDFYRESHMHLFEGMTELYNNNEPIDLVTLSQYLKEKDLLEKVGSTDYLASLVDAVSTSAGIVHHAEIVRDLSVRRKLINQCSAISESCFQSWQGTDELLDLAEQSIFDIAEDKIGETFSPIEDVIKGSFKKLESVAEQEGFVTGISTGFKDFDRYTAGLQPSDLIIIAGRPSMGKTSLALNIGYNAAEQTGKGVAIFSLEMAKLQLGLRLLGFHAGIDATKLRTGFLRDTDWMKLTDSANRLSELPIFIDDTSWLNVLEMKAKCRRLMKKVRLGLVIIDYLQLIQGRRSAESRQMEISEISRSLKALAKDLNVPVMALSQLNRKVEDRPNKRPQLADLRESGAIEQDADVIAFIYRDELYHPVSEENRNVAEIIIAKQRNGPTGLFKLTFQKELTRFKDYVEEDRYEF
ncbi:MAG: replicative DNA helicase [Deltaproteobacteria bacterium]|nr:replicative DNA helicase [Deltaproteobacteria bacterium]MBW1918889.1 replicative DNA helicase [Deltaproteobacteria bacterium]MBW1934677.1 replicative DNA helicase [Deltaproteobacteria bacterium]MBW1976949.1 replicative DNA helicase [Deltaproteobacteria bacterium]MBW2043533.1 replicative DNA helicase [Deltaproteobacteria bacterium]